MKPATRTRPSKAPRAPRPDTQTQDPGDAYVAALARAALDDELLGQERALDTLSKALGSGHFPHAWVFYGPSGIGKCTTAMRVAALLVDPLTVDAGRIACAPTRDSHSARLLRAGTHPDVRVIRAELASSSADRELRERKQLNIPVGLLREHMIGGVDSGGGRLEAPIARSSALGAGKVFIIDGADRLEADGQNVLLKTLEEPPAGTTIILVTRSVDRLLPTIRSRCQSVGFAPLSAPLMSRWLDTRLGEVTGTSRAFVELFAAGSPGAAVTAVELGLQSWYEELVPMIDRFARGECPLELADRMNDIASDIAEAAIKRNENASKEAANRDAVGVLLAVIGREVERRLHASAQNHRALAYWAQVPGVIAAAERNLSANVNQKLALAEFVAQWSMLTGQTL